MEILKSPKCLWIRIGLYYDEKVIKAHRLIGFVINLLITFIFLIALVLKFVLLKREEYSKSCKERLNFNNLEFYENAEKYCTMFTKMPLRIGFVAYDVIFPCCTIARWSFK